MRVELLEREAARFDFSTLPFVQAVQSGECPLELLQDYAMQVAGLATGLPRLLGSILALCDDPDVRCGVIANLIDEEGLHVEGGHALVRSGNDSHGVLAVELARALGVPDGTPVPIVKRKWIDAELQAGRWLGPLAFFTVGHEANVPAVFGPLAEGLRDRYGYSDDQLRFLIMHVAADEEHGAEGMAMIARVATTPALEQEALQGARRGVVAWYHLHRHYAHAARRVRSAAR